MGRTEDVKFSFGVIVLNGEPFIRYTIDALYPHAHQIIVVEGAAPAASSISTPDGHSRDKTLNTLRDLAANHDPEGKLIIVTAEDEGHPNGFWPGEKHEQSAAYAKRATGSHLWQVDVDEFYLPRDIEAIRRLLAEDPEISQINFKQITFWGAPNVVADSWYLRSGAEIYRRLFRWGPGYRYVSHRPPTVVDEKGRDLSKLKVINGYEIAERNIVLYHYSLLLPKQVQEKCEYYSAADWAGRSKMVDWANEAYFKLRRPFRVHNVYEYPGWLSWYTGEHPPAVNRMWRDLNAPGSSYAIRDMADADRLLRSPWYWLARACLRRGVSTTTALSFATRVLVRLRQMASRLLSTAKRIAWPGQSR